MITKNDFHKILCSYTPEELNQFITSKGKIKMVNGITFVKNNDSDNLEIQKNQSSNLI